MLLCGQPRLRGNLAIPVGGGAASRPFLLSRYGRRGAFLDSTSSSPRPVVQSSTCQERSCRRAGATNRVRHTLSLLFVGRRQCCPNRHAAELCQITAALSRFVGRPPRCRRIVTIV